FMSALLRVCAGMNAHGRIVFEGEVFSPALGTQRMVRIYLPPDYESSPRKRYPVLYVHDGQNAFSTAGPHAAFGWGNWQLDTTADHLIHSGRIRPIIIVAVDCSESRYREYRGPGAAPKSISRTKAKQIDDSPFGRYARFLITELKPKIDSEYRTVRGSASTATMGSSMGGICSLALGWEYPEVFGEIASLSGAFQVERKSFLRRLQKHEGAPKKIRIYLDSGVIDYSGGDDGEEDTTSVANALIGIGWRPGKNLLHFVDAKPLTEEELKPYGLDGGKIKEAQTSQHNEFYWRIRAHRPLEFLFPPK
ncbi:MAG: esterase, partial [Verrucomicrobiales bacterium]|nr:esterase [Verrucomicrobiales bacterium]